MHEEFEAGRMTFEAFDEELVETRPLRDAGDGWIDVSETEPVESTEVMRRLRALGYI